MKILKTIDNFFNWVADTLIWIILIAGLTILAYYCDWEYQKANTKEALQEYNLTK